MHKDTLTLLENVGPGLGRDATTGHARQAAYQPRAAFGKAIHASTSKTVLLVMGVGDAGEIDIACVAMLAGAGHRVVALMGNDSIPGALRESVAAGQVLALPGIAVDTAAMQKAIKGLAPPFRAVDAVVDIMPMPARRLALLDAQVPLVELFSLADGARLLAATRAAMPGLIASGRGHVVVVTPTAQHHRDVAGHDRSAPLWLTLRAELDALGIRFTRLAAGPMERRAAVDSQPGNRPRPGGMSRDLLSPADIAQAVAWTLAQPDHVAVRDVTLGPAPRGQPVLSPREQEVLEWTACGKTSEEISCILGLSVSAVNFHVKNLLCKLQCCNKTAAVARAALLGLLA